MNVLLVLVVAVTFFCAGNLFSTLNREVSHSFPAPGEVFVLDGGGTYEWTCDWELKGGKQ